MRFFAYHYLDLNDEKTWSGTPANIIRALERRGHEVFIRGPVHPRPYLISRLKSFIYKYFLKRTYMQARDPWVNRMRAKHAMADAKQIPGIDVILSFYLPELFGFKTTRPIIAIQDATFELLLDYYDSFSRRNLAWETLRDGIKLDRIGFAKTGHAIYCSEWAAKAASAQHPDAHRRISVQPFGASVEEPPSEQAVRELASLRLAQSTCKLLFIGKEWNRKGGPLAVSITEELIARGVPCELHVVGCTPAEDLPSFVHVHGLLWKNHEADGLRLRALFNECKFFLLPSEAECFGLVYCEAAAFGLPAIATRSGGVSSAVHASWGVLLPSGSSPGEYVAALIRIHNDDGLYAEMAMAAYKDYVHRLNWDVFTDHLVSVSDELVSRMT